MNAADFVANLYRDLRQAVDAVRADRAVAQGTQSAGLITIQRLTETSPDLEALARIKGFATADQDEVVTLQMRGGKEFVLGTLQRSAPTGYSLDAMLTPAGIIGEIVPDNISADAADTASTTAISTFQQAYNQATALPAGTWTIRALGWLDLKNSAGNNGQLRLQIDANPGGTRTVALNSTTYQTAKCHATQSAVSGGRSVNILLEYHGVTSGTTSAQNPALLILAQRTA